MSGRRPSFRDRLELGLYLPLAALLRALPENAALGLGAGLGALAGGSLKIRRAVVEENLARAFPDESLAWRRHVAAASYRHMGRETVTALRLARARPGEILERTEVHGLDDFLRAASEGGAILVTGHLGNWELGGAVLAARGVAVDAVAYRQRNRLIDAKLVGNRERLGMKVVHRSNAGREVLRSVATGRVPALLADQDAGRRGIFVEFLGPPASTTRGPALLALRSGARLFGGVCLARGTRPHRYIVYLEELTAERTGDLAEDVRRLTQAHTDFLARYVKLAPEQYFWQHKRWKTRPRAAVG